MTNLQDKTDHDDKRTREQCAAQVYHMVREARGKAQQAKWFMKDDDPGIRLQAKTLFVYYSDLATYLESCRRKLASKI
jgi:hypothetical protein